MAKTIVIFEDLLNHGYNLKIKTLGSSMFPVLRTGDRIIVAPERDFNVGDLLVFKQDDQMVCHRFVKIFEKDGIKYFQTRGDSFFGLDEPVTAGQILGKVVRIERENLSFPRRVLLLLYPALKFGKVNAFVISALVKIKNCLPTKKSL